LINFNTSYCIKIRAISIYNQFDLGVRVNQMCTKRYEKSDGFFMFVLPKGDLKESQVPQLFDLVSYW